LAYEALIDHAIEEARWLQTSEKAPEPAAAGGRHTADEKITKLHLQRRKERGAGCKPPEKREEGSAREKFNRGSARACGQGMCAETGKPVGGGGGRIKGKEKNPSFVTERVP